MAALEEDRASARVAHWGRIALRTHGVMDGLGETVSAGAAKAPGPHQAEVLQVSDPSLVAEGKLPQTTFR